MHNIRCFSMFGGSEDNHIYNKRRMIRGLMNSIAFLNNGHILPGYSQSKGLLPDSGALRFPGCDKVALHSVAACPLENTVAQQFRMKKK